MVRYEGRPAALVLADDVTAAERAAAAADLAGCRLLGQVAVRDAMAVLADPPAFQLIIAELEQDHGDLLDRVLTELGRSAESGRPVVISAAPELTDPIAAQAWAPAVRHLCRPTEEQMVEAITAASQPVAAQLHDIGKERLQQLSQDAARIASALASLSAAAENQPGSEKPQAEDGEIDSAKIRTIIRARRLREQYFPSDLFADPAWDMLLDLAAARLDGQHVAVSSLCIAAAVPATTALRWIKALTEQGLFVRVADPRDGRRVHIELSDRAATAVIDYLKAAQRLGTSII